MRPSTALLALGALALVLVTSTAGGSSVNPPNPHKLTTNPVNGNPISTFGNAPALSEAAMVQLIADAGFTGAGASKALAIARRESGFHPGAVVDTRGMSAADLRAYWGKPALQEWSAGLWQINVLSSPQYTVDYLQDPANAAAAAFTLSRGGTWWAPWGG